MAAMISTSTPRWIMVSTWDFWVAALSFANWKMTSSPFSSAWAVRSFSSQAQRSWFWVGKMTPIRTGSWALAHAGECQKPERQRCGGHADTGPASIAARTASHLFGHCRLPPWDVGVFAFRRHFGWQLLKHPPLDQHARLAAAPLDLPSGPQLARADFSWSPRSVLYGPSAAGSFAPCASRQLSLAVGTAASSWLPRGWPASCIR